MENFFGKIQKSDLQQPPKFKQTALPKGDGHRSLFHHRRGGFLCSKSYLVNFDSEGTLYTPSIRL